MHHIYARRIVIALVSFFGLLALLFGPLVVSLRSQIAPAASACDCAGEEGAAAVTLPDGDEVFNNFCAVCHQAQTFADELSQSLDADTVSRAQLEKLVGPPAHGGVSPVEALAVVIALRSRAGLPSTFPEGVPTPAGEATAAAAPTPTPIPLEELIAAGDNEGVFNQYCAACHQAEVFAEGLRTDPAPDTRSRQAVLVLPSSPAHKVVPAGAMAPAMNYIRELAGLEPLP